MIRNLNKQDITKVMTIWTKGNFYAHPFIERDYWISQYNKIKEKYLTKTEIYIYENNKEIEGFISIMPENEIDAIYVTKNRLREGIGKKLINYCKEKKKQLIVHVYEKNINAILFYIAMGFKNKKIQIQKETGEKEYIMEWNEKNNDN